MSISPVSSHSNAAASNTQASHTIQHGDTLSAIARENGVSLSALLAANPQIRNPDVIYPGDRLDIPAGGGSPATGTGSASPAGDVSPTGGKFDYDRISGVQGNPNVTPAFLQGVEDMAARLGTKPEYLLAVMSFETGGSFSPGQKNTAGSGATGLIQFMPNTASELGTSTSALSKMSSVDQLQYVEKYFMNRAGAHNGNLSTLEGVYTSVLYGSPRSDPNTTLWSSGSSAYRWNSGLDRNGDGRITAGEAANAVRARVDGNIDAGGSTIPDKPGQADPGNGKPGGGDAGTRASYTVRSGDTLSQIAASNGMSLDALISANPQIGNPNLIYPGQTIELSGSGGTYTVQGGDTMSGIAASHGVSLSALVNANPQVRDPNLIHPNQQLHLPGGPSGTSGTEATSGTSGTSGTPGTGNGNVVDIARGFLGRNASDLKRSGELPMESWVPNNVNCANFVTAVLQKAGMINWHDNTVAGTASRLKAQGWKVVPASQAKPGDVCILNYGGHVELVASNNNGNVRLIGSNNINPDGSQQVSYGNPYGNAYYLSPP
jgi:LysM repeat protein